MSNFFASIRKPGSTYEVALNDSFKVSPQSWSAKAVGGCEKAALDIEGAADAVWSATNWLGYHVSIYNPLGDLVWWGHLNEITVSQGAFSAGLTLDTMSNRIKVAYSYTQPDNSVIRGDTAYSQDNPSVNRFGKKELQYTSKGDLLFDAATELRDSLLEQLKRPLPAITSGRADQGNANGQLLCRGDFSLLGWEYYTELRGLEESRTSSNAEIPVGYGFTTTASWTGAEDREVWAFDDVLSGLHDGMVIDVENGANAGVYTVDGRARGEIQTTTGSVTFIDNDEFTDATGIAGKWGTGDIFKIDGSSSNDGIYRIERIEDRTRVEVTDPGLLVGTDASVTLTRGQFFRVEEAPLGVFGSTSNFTPRGYTLAQSFTLTNNVSSWTCDKISIQLLRVGNPSDSLKVELRSGDANAPSATVLASDTLLGSEIFDTNRGWYEFDMGNTVSLSYGTHYWIVVSRTGALDGASYYNVFIDEDAPYTLGNLRLGGIGSNWYARATNATMPFSVRGKEENTTQITNIATNYAQFVAGLDILNPSTIETNQYRDGDTKSLPELEALLEQGVNGGRRYLARMTPERQLIVYEEPAEPEYPQVSIGSDGQLNHALGGAYPAGRLPAGQWVRVDFGHLAGDALTKLSPYFVERAEYNARSGETRLEPRESDPFAIEVGQG